MTPIPLADTPRIPLPRPDAEVTQPDDRADLEGALAAFLAAMGQAPAPAGSPSVAQDTGNAVEPAVSGKDAGAITVAALLRPAPATGAGEVAASAAANRAATTCSAEAAQASQALPQRHNDGDLAGQMAPDSQRRARLAPVPVSEIAFHASSGTNEPAAGDTTADGRPASAVAAAATAAGKEMAAADGSAAARTVAAGTVQRSIRPGVQAGQAVDDPAIPDDGAMETGPASPATKAAERTAVPVQPPRAGLAEHTPESVRVAPAGAAGADGASMGETRQAPPPEASATRAAATGATVAVHAGSNSAGGSDPLPAAHEAALGLVPGADPTLGARAADRPHPVGQAVAHLPPGFGHRLAEAVVQLPDRTIELTLTPEELGRVRMTLATHDGTLTLAIHTDRPETIDLMRRHIDQLAQDFRDLGFSDLSFSFGHDDSARYGGSDARQADITAAEPAAPTLVPIPSIPGRGPRGEPDGGIDLRL